MAAGDLTDLATARLAANIATSSSPTDQILGTLISAISAQVPQALDCNILSASYAESYQGNGKESLLLRQRPITAIASVAWAGQLITAAGDPASSAIGIWHDDRNARLVGYCFPRGEIVKITYTAGYATAPLDISLAVAELVAEAYARRTHVGESSRSQGGQITVSFDSKAMHAAIASKLRNYMHGAPC